MAGSVMRAETLADAEVIGMLNQRFESGWENLMPELFGSADPNAVPPKYAQAQIENLPEGAGGGNIRCYFCDADGIIIHQTLGYWRKERFLEECRFAEKLLAMSPVDRRQAQADRLARTRAEWEAGRERLSAKLNFKDPQVRSVVGCGIRVRGLEELSGDLGKPVEDVINRRRDEVYTKGAIGCDQ